MNTAIVIFTVCCVTPFYGVSNLSRASWPGYWQFRSFQLCSRLSLARRATWPVHGQSLPRQAPGGRESGHRQTGDSKQNHHTKTPRLTAHSLAWLYGEAADTVSLL